MEHNQEMKTKKKSLIPLIACIAVVVVCALATVGVLLSKNMGTDKEVATDTERIEIEQNEAGEMLAKDEASLRQLLLDDETYTIAITEDIYVSEPLTVNGTKTLVGDKSIIMNLNTPAKERVCSVSEGAHLILDGATIDGNGVSSGIEVEYGGKLDCLSGSIVYPMPYGIVTEGVVNVEDITIDRSMHTGIYVEAGGELYMNGGKITNCIQTGIATSTKAYAKVSKDAVIQKSAGSLFYNFGTLDITGGTFSDSYSNCIYNKGELNIISESDDKLVEFFDSGRSVISSVAGTTVNIDGLYVHDIAAHAMNLEKDSVGDVKNVLVENTGKSSFYTNGSKLTMQDIELKDIKSVGINITNKSTVELKDITILNGGHRGIINDTSTVTMKDIKVDNLVGAGIITMGEKSVTKIENAKISKVGKSGIGITGGTVTAKDIEITDAAGTAIYTTTDKSKTTIDGAKLVNSGKSAIGVSIGTLTAKNVEINGTANTGVYIQKDAKLTLSDATIKGVHKHGIANYFGTAVVKNVSIEAPTNAGILNQGTLTGEKVTINKSGSRAMSLTDASTTNIKGLTINESKNQSVYIDGVTSAHISDFTIDKSGQSAFRITKSTDVLLKSGTITNANGDGIYVAEKAKIKVQDTTITKPVQHGVEILGEGAEVTAINVTVNEPTRAGLVNNGGAINGSVVKIEDSGSRAVSLINKSTTSITGLTVKNAGDQGVYIDGTTKVVLKEIDLDKTKSAAIRVANADNVSIKTGTIKNAGTDAVYAGEASKMKVEAVDIKDTAKYGLNCVKGEITAIKVTVKDATAGIVNNAGTINGNTVAIEDTSSRGANLLAGSTTNITGLTIKNAGAQGIYVDSATKVSINGIDIDGTKQGAVAVVKATDVLIKGNAEAKLNTIKNVKTSAINTSEGAKIKVQDINIVGTEDEEKIKENTKYGLNIAKDSEITAVNVDIKNVVAGVYNDGGTFGGNTIAINTTSSRAVNLLSSSTTNITGLTIKNVGDQGVYVESSAATISDFLVDTTKSAAISLGVPKETEGSNSAETAAKVTLNSGTIKASGTDGVYVGKTTTANLTGVTIESAGRHGIYNDGGTVDGTTLTINQSTNRAVSMATDSKTTINGLNITGTGDQAVYVAGGKEAKTEIKGFEISGSSSAAVRVMNTKDVKLTDGTINATSYGIATSDDATVIAEDVRINRIKGNENSLIWVMKDSTVTLQNGKDTKKESWSVVDGKGLSGRGVEIEENATFYLNNGTIQNNNLEKEESGAGILVKANGIFVMNNGTITKNNSTKSDGGGVHVEENGTFTFKAGDITDNDAKACGAGVSARGTFTMEGGNITLNEANKGAGVIVRSAATFEMTGGTISGNTATAEGGGIFVQKSSSMSGGTIASNIATKGAGVYVGAGTFTMTGGSINSQGKLKEPNAATGNGVYVNSGASFKMSNQADISYNYSSKEGNGVYVLEGGSFTMNGGTIQYNHTTSTGSGVSSYGSFTLNSGNIYHNTADTNAGGVIIRNTGSFSMTGGTVDGNTTDGKGGGIYIQSTSNDTSISGGTIQNNEAANGGGIYLEASGKTFSLSGAALITANKATTAGAGVYAEKGTFTMSGGSITNHGTSAKPSTAEGAGVYVKSKLSMSGGTISNNHTTKNGAGVATYASSGFSMSQLSTIQNNTATGDGGAVYVGSGTYTLNNGAEETLYKNTANNGGAVAVAGGTFHLKKGNITQNQATANGGGVYVARGTFKTTETSVKTISSNTAGNFGGGLYLEAGTTCELAGSKLSFNTNSAVRGMDMYLVGQITLKSALTDEISISPATYSTETVVALNGGIASEAFVESMEKISVEAYKGNHWYVNESGKLAAPVVLDGVSYASLNAALAAVGEEATIKILHNQEISSTVEVAGKLTLTCAENVTITANDSLDGNMFNVAKDGTLVINGAAADKKTTLAGGSATDYVINNNGTTLLSNVNITGGVRGIHHGAGTLGTEEKPLANVNISDASEYGVYVYAGNVDIDSIIVEDAGHSAIYIQKEDANVLIRKAELYNSGSYGLVVKKGNVTVKNTVIDNDGISDTSKDRIGIAAHGGILNLDNVSIKNFVGSKTKNNNHGIELAGSQLNVTANETVDGGNKGLYIYNVKGHGIYATKGEMNIAKISIDGNSQTRAGIRIYASETMTNVITSASITGCAAEVQIKDTTLTIHGVELTAGSSQVQKTIDEINAMK